MRDLIKKILSEEIVYGGSVVCDNCGWNWKLSDGGDEKYICHKCGHDNTPTKSNFVRFPHPILVKFKIITFLFHFHYPATTVLNF
jgi:DNA-directed RNA polymerase subunit RPC12/RpoP